MSKESEGGREEQIEYIKDIRQKVYEKNALEAMERIAEFAKKIQSEFPDKFQKYQAYHIMSGSTVREGESLEFDFPGEYSVMNFLEKLLKELPDKKG